MRTLAALTLTLALVYAVHPAAAYDRRLYRAINISSPEDVTDLLKAGADPNAKDGEGCTPLLHSAAKYGFPKIIAALLAADADPNAKERVTGRTPLHLAKEPKATTAALLEAGANPNAKEDYGITPLHLAVMPKKKLRLNSGPIADYNVGINEDRPGHAVPPALGSRPSIHSIQRGSTGLSRFPGCPVTQRLHGHHVRHWAEGGETSLDNLVLLCPTHHRLVHKGGFNVQRLDDGAFRFTTLSYTAEVKMFDRLKRQLAAYRVVGQPRQEELVTLLDRAGGRCREAHRLGGGPLAAVMPRSSA